MDLLTVLGWIGVGALCLIATYAASAMTLLVFAFRLAAREEEIPPSLDCRDGHHATCLGCSCPHHQ